MGSQLINKRNILIISFFFLVLSALTFILWYFSKNKSSITLKSNVNGYHIDITDSKPLNSMLEEISNIGGRIYDSHSKKYIEIKKYSLILEGSELSKFGYTLEGYGYSLSSADYKISEDGELDMQIYLHKDILSDKKKRDNILNWQFTKLFFSIPRENSIFENIDRERFFSSSELSANFVRTKDLVDKYHQYFKEGPFTIENE